MKSNINLGDKSKFVGYGTNGETNCFDLCKIILNNYGINNPGNSSNVYTLKREHNGNLVYFGDNVFENYQNAINCIDNHLENGRPIMVGVHHTFNKVINDGTTDHFVVIYGRGFDGVNQYYNYYEVGKKDVYYGYNDETNRFIYDSNTPDFYDEVSNRKDGCRFDVIQIRPNDGSII